MKKMHLLGIAALGLCLSSFAMAQDDNCEGDKTILACIDRIQSAAELPATRENANATAAAEVTTEMSVQKATVEKKLDDAQTGANSGGAATAASLTDLAPLFDALGLLSTGSSDSGTLTFNLNWLLPVQDVDNNNTQLQLLVNTQPAPLDQLIQAFPEDVRAVRKDSLQKGISAFGDAQLSFTWSLVNSRFGRDFSVLRHALAPIYNGAVVHAQTTSLDDAKRKNNDVIRRVDLELAIANARPGATRASRGATPIDDLPLPADLKAELIEASLSVANARATELRAIRSELSRTRIDGLAELVQQQPQLLFSLGHDIRDELVGPEKTSATVTWELTRHNFSAFLNGDGKSCKSEDVNKGAEQYDKCVRALQTYVGDGGVDLQKQWRLKIAASYQRVQSVTYGYPNDGVSLRLPDTDRWEVSLAAGRPLGGRASNDRIDLEVAYDSNIDNNTTNKERLKASLTYTRHLGNVDVPFSLVYANKSEFLGAVDHQVSMHFGLKFRQAK
jgi:hypothetical protein